MPSIWFHVNDGNLSEVLTYYQSVFKDDFSPSTITNLGETPSGHTEICEITIFQQPYSFMATAKLHQPLNDAVSFTIRCKDQEDIDSYWDYFTEDGQASQCGWCIDKYGLRWQIIPGNLGSLMQRPNAMEVMMKQTKIIMAEFE